jgi:AcrR family transcriptional regulator
VGTLSKKLEQGQATRRALLDAAREEFAARGYAATAIDGIVRRAGVTKGACYHHFSGKEDLFLQVYENAKKELSRAAFVTHLDHKPFAAPEEQSHDLERFVEQTNEEVWRQLVERCRRYVELHIDPRIRQIVLVDARSVLPWEVWLRIEREQGVVLLRADLRRAMLRGILERLPLHPLAAILAGALNEVCLLVANAVDADTTLDEAMLILERFLDGLKVPQTSDGRG